MSEQLISGWGRVGVVGQEIHSDDLPRLPPDVTLCRGLGRSYGDSSLPASTKSRVACTTLADRLLYFDPNSGRVTLEAGVSLRALARLFLPRGWFVPVTPGTSDVTVGGMVAADVHGKNHHVDGCFGSYVDELLMRVADGRTIVCSRNNATDLFWATIGGMGLTGHILEVTFRMSRIPSSWISAESVRLDNIDTLLQELRDSSNDWPFTVAWVDGLSGGRTLGRGIVYKGRWSKRSANGLSSPEPRRTPAVPCDLPNWVLNRWSVGRFNDGTYYRHGARTRLYTQSPYDFFYPLDSVGDWNRVYGRRGFTQYQCVIPERHGHEGMRQLLQHLSEKHANAFLCVIKNCGDEGHGLLSFPLAGMSAAIDLPIDRDTQSLVDFLNEWVIGLGGRIYLAKDTFTRAEHFKAMEPRLAHWKSVRCQWDPTLRIRSAQSVRIFGDPE